MMRVGVLGLGLMGTAIARRLLASGFEVLGSSDSCLPGPKGNVEHFVHARRKQGVSGQASGV